jgi:hypothetical protein
MVALPGQLFYSCRSPSASGSSLKGIHLDKRNLDAVLLAERI